MLQQIGIDFSKAASVTYEAGNDDYPVLTQKQQQSLFTWLNSQYRSSDVDTVNDLCLHWKQDSYCDEAQTFELIFKKAIKISQSERNSNLNGRSPQGDEENIAYDLHSFSASFVQRWLSSDIEVFRGAGHQLPELAVELIENPNKSVLYPSPNSLSNYTPSKPVAEKFGRVIFSQNIDPDDVAIAADSIFPKRDPTGSPIKRHGELRINGDEITDLKVKKVLARGTQRPLITILKNPSTLSQDEHDVVAGLVEILAGDKQSISTQQGLDLLRDWYSEFLLAHPLEAIKLKNDFDDIT